MEEDNSYDNEMKEDNNDNNEIEEFERKSNLDPKKGRPILKVTNIMEILPKLDFNKSITILNEIIERVLELHWQLRGHYRCHILSLVAGILSRKQLSLLGFEFSNSQYTKAIKIYKEKDLIPKDEVIRKRSRSDKVDILQETINNYLILNSKPSSKKISLQGNKFPLRYLNKPIAQIYIEMKQKGIIKISKGYFYKLIPKYFKYITEIKTLQYQNEEISNKIDGEKINDLELNNVKETDMNQMSLLDQNNTLIPQEFTDTMNNNFNIPNDSIILSDNTILPDSDLPFLQASLNASTVYTNNLIGSSGFTSNNFIRSAPLVSTNLIGSTVFTSNDLTLPSSFNNSLTSPTPFSSNALIRSTTFRPGLTQSISFSSDNITYFNTTSYVQYNNYLAPIQTLPTSININTNNTNRNFNKDIT